MQAALYAGLLVGLIASSYVLQMTSVMMIFMLSTLVLFLATIYVIFFVTESVVQRSDTEKGFVCVNAVFIFIFWQLCNV